MKSQHTDYLQFIDIGQAKENCILAYSEKDNQQHYMNCIIIEDDLKFSNHLQETLHNFNDLTVTGTASTIEEGKKLILLKNPDVVFLDMELPDGKGLELLENLQNLDFHTIVISAHQEYALKALQLAAIDYLLKPFDIACLHSAIKKVRDLKLVKGLANKYLMANERETNYSKKHIGISNLNEIKYVKLEDIVYCKADGSYTSFNCQNETKDILSSKPIKHYQEILEDFDFCRVHKSFLVNLRQVQSFKKIDGGVLFMNNGKKVDVSRNKKEGVLKKLAVL